MNIIEEFLEYLKLERGFSDHTITNYKIDLYEFYNYNKGYNASLNQIRDYIKYLNDKKYKNSTISRKISSLKSFYKYLHSHGLIESNPMILISSPKKEKKLPTFLSYNEVEKLLNAPDTSTKEGLMHALILEMLYSTGIRVSELVNIKIDDIDQKERVIKIYGKGSKERMVYYGSECEKLLNSYISQIDGYLFKNKHGKKLNDRTVRKIVDEYAVKANISIHVTPHVLRHTYATHMLNDGADLKSVGDLLGHESLSTTQIYTHVSNERLRSVYLRSHPRAKR